LSLCYLYVYCSYGVHRNLHSFLHDALPIFEGTAAIGVRHGLDACAWGHAGDGNLHSTFLVAPDDVDELRRAHEAADDLFARRSSDRKSTRLNSSHVAISYAVFCLKKKKIQQ